MDTTERGIYSGRVEAGRALARHLEEFQGTDAIVIAIPRGGVVVGHEVAAALSLPLDVVIPRKIGAPGQPELAIGAVAVDDQTITILDDDMVRLLRVPKEYIERAVWQEADEIRRRTALYREGRPAPEMADRVVIVVDDGVATGYTIRAAIRSLRARGPRRLVLAVPVGPPETVGRLRQEVDQLICPFQPDPFVAVGAWYESFPQVTDEEVIGILRDSAGG